MCQRNLCQYLHFMELNPEYTEKGLNTNSVYILMHKAKLNLWLFLTITLCASPFARIDATFYFIIIRTIGGIKLFGLK